MQNHLLSSQSAVQSQPWDEDVIFWEEESEDSPSTAALASLEDTLHTQEAWPALIVDDEPDVHQATRLALQGFQFEGRVLELTSAYSGQEGREILSRRSDIAVILLDVVMEHSNAGLELVQFIREELGNPHIRIILRTGQPGEAPEAVAILNYDINDYQLKVDITRQRLMTTMISALRSYRDLMVIERQRADLEASFDLLQQLQQQLKIYSQDLELQVAERTTALRNANAKLKRLANLDGLTQVANRRFFDTQLAAQWNIALACQQALCLILVDVDYFKRYNDRYGHQAGDECLKRVARLMEQQIARPQDLVARYGGEEFVVLLPGTSQQGGRRVASSIIEALAAENIPHDSSLVSDRVTLSAGISWVVPQPNTPMELLVETADRSLYRAKQMGRNQFQLYAPQADS